MRFTILEFSSAQAGKSLGARSCALGEEFNLDAQVKIAARAAGSLENNVPHGRKIKASMFKHEQMKFQRQRSLVDAGRRSRQAGVSHERNFPCSNSRLCRRGEHSWFRGRRRELLFTMECRGTLSGGHADSDVLRSWRLLSSAAERGDKAQHPACLPETNRAMRTASDCRTFEARVFLRVWPQDTTPMVMFARLPLKTLDSYQQPMTTAASSGPCERAFKRLIRKMRPESVREKSGDAPRLCGHFASRNGRSRNGLGFRRVARACIGFRGRHRSVRNRFSKRDDYRIARNLRRHPVIGALLGLQLRNAPRTRQSSATQSLLRRSAHRAALRLAALFPLPLNQHPFRDARLHIHFDQFVQNFNHLLAQIRAVVQTRQLEGLQRSLRAACNVLQHHFRRLHATVSDRLISAVILPKEGQHTVITQEGNTQIISTGTVLPPPVKPFCLRGSERCSNGG